MANNERIISERVVGKKVIGSANPIARKFRALKSSFGGVIMAPILVIIAIGLLWYGESFKKSSAVVESLNLETANEVSSDASGMHKISGVPSEVEDITVPNTDIAGDFEGLLYYSFTLQAFEEVEETETKTETVVEEGKDVEVEKEVVKLVQKWVDKETKSDWASFKLGSITVVADSASKKVNTKSAEYSEKLVTEGDQFVYKYVSKDGVTTDPAIDDKRIQVRYLSDDQDMIVIGEISNGEITGGETFIVSNMSDSQLFENLKNTEMTIYWVLKFVVWVLLTIGIMSLLGPVLSLLDFIPIAGKAASCAASVVAGVISFLVVLFATLIIKFWWLFLILLVLGVVGLIILIVMLVMKSSGGDEDEKKEEKK